MGAKEWFRSIRDCNPESKHALRTREHDKQSFEVSKASLKE